MSKYVRDPKTIWKLIDAQCQQLSDAVAAARVPFLLSLLWAFIWAWSLYSAEFGYLASFYRHRLAASVSYADASKSPEALQFKIDCNRVTGGSISDIVKAAEAVPASQQADLNKDQKARCKTALSNRLDWAEKTYLSSTVMSFPGGFPAIEESDLGVIGQAGLLLILIWLFYAMRREHHAIRTFVDMDKNTRDSGVLFPKSFVLEPQESFFSAEHLAYAYHAVSQRFVFIFSKYDRPLLGVTVFLFAIPGIVASLHVFSDLFDVIDYDWASALSVRLLVEGIMLILVWYVTIGIMHHVLKSNTLLHGWFLASKHIWIDEWDETNEDPASRVRIDMPHQTKKMPSGWNHTVAKNAPQPALATDKT
jgi:hypothetical protein